MNMQAMLKQAQAMQRDMMKAKEEIDKTSFVGENGLVKVTMDGTKKITSVEIDKEGFEADDLEMLQDMFLVATNDAMNKVDKLTEEKMGKYTKGMPGLF
jgi:DNA-binding YbaB/EbfC family protein